MPRLNSIPLRHYFIVLLLMSVVSLAIVVARPPLRYAMPFFAVQILFGILVLVRAATDSKIDRRNE